MSKNIENYMKDNTRPCLFPGGPTLSPDWCERFHDRHPFCILQHCDGAGGRTESGPRPASVEIHIAGFSNGQYDEASIFTAYGRQRPMTSPLFVETP